MHWVSWVPLRPNSDWKPCRHLSAWNWLDLIVIWRFQLWRPNEHRHVWQKKLDTRLSLGGFCLHWFGKTCLRESSPPISSFNLNRFVVPWRAMLLASSSPDKLVWILSLSFSAAQVAVQQTSLQLPPRQPYLRNVSNLESLGCGKTTRAGNGSFHFSFDLARPPDFRQSKCLTSSASLCYLCASVAAKFPVDLCCLTSFGWTQAQHGFNPGCFTPPRKRGGCFVVKC